MDPKISKSQEALKMMLNDKIFACVNTKGGVGKSATALQVLVPYLYQTTAQIPLVVDIDENNFNSKVFSDSEIMTAKCVEIKNFDREFGDIAAEVVSKRPIVLDIGAADITRNALKVIDTYGPRVRNRMVWLVPISTGQNDIRNAMETIEMINGIAPNQKIIIVLSNAPENHGEDNQINEITFSYFFGNPVLDIPSMYKIMGKTYPYLAVPGHYIVPATQAFKKTIYEVGKNFSAFDESVDKKILELSKRVKDNPDDEPKIYEESKRITRIAQQYRVAKMFAEYNLSETFSGLTQILLKLL